MQKDEDGAVKWPELYLAIGNAETAAVRAWSSAKSGLSDDERQDIGDKAALAAAAEVVHPRRLSKGQVDLVQVISENPR